MYRGIIVDNLSEREIKTKKCNTEAEAKTEAQESIERLCKNLKIEIIDNRFVLDCIEVI